MSNKALGSFMKDLMATPIDSLSEVSIVDDNAKCLAPETNPIPGSPECKQRRHWFRHSDGARIGCSPDGKSGTDVSREATIRSHVSTRVEIDLLNRHRKRESRWQSMSQKSCCEARLVTPKRKSCPPSLMVDMGGVNLSAQADELVRRKTCDDKLKVPTRISPLELDFCLSEILADAKASAGTLKSLEHVDEAIDIAESFPKLDACLG